MAAKLDRHQTDQRIRARAMLAMALRHRAKAEAMRNEAQTMFDMARVVTDKIVRPPAPAVSAEHRDRRPSHSFSSLYSRLQPPMVRKTA